MEGLNWRHGQSAALIGVAGWLARGGFRAVSSPHQFLPPSSCECFGPELNGGINPVSGGEISPLAASSCRHGLQGLVLCPLLQTLPELLAVWLIALGPCFVAPDRQCCAPPFFFLFFLPAPLFRHFLKVWGQFILQSPRNARWIISPVSFVLCAQFCQQVGGNVFIYSSICLFLSLFLF